MAWAVLAQCQVVGADLGADDAMGATRHRPLVRGHADEGRTRRAYVLHASGLFLGESELGLAKVGRRRRGLAGGGLVGVGFVEEKGRSGKKKEGKERERKEKEKKGKRETETGSG